MVSMTRSSWPKTSKPMDGTNNMTRKYKPVEGCEECEYWGEACAECMLYGEAELIKPETEEAEDGAR